MFLEKQRVLVTHATITVESTKTELTISPQFTVEDNPTHRGLWITSPESHASLNAHYT